MNQKQNSVDKLLTSLKERAKELNCLYEVEELFSSPDGTLPDILQGIVRAIPPGWQFPDICEARVVCGDHTYQSEKWKETPWMMKADVVVQEEAVGSIQVCYTEEMPAADEGPFLKEERRLKDVVAGIQKGQRRFGTVPRTALGPSLKLHLECRIDKTGINL